VRHTVKPGVTGWGQLQYGVYYIKNQSLLLDLMMILQTVEVVLWGKGER
jgi:lipopolysaccharide/colanic/teichoic acid biosynthesis glycosyltransferase